MEHLREEELVLFYYRESRHAGRIQAHLDACPPCRSSYAELSDSLATLDEFTVPERPEDYGARVWQRVRPRFDSSRPARAGLFRWPVLHWAQAGWVAALVLLGLFLGRYLPGPEREELRQMRELLALSLLQNQSASERLAGVSYSRDADPSDARVVNALVDALNYDPDVNVRLATVDALGRLEQHVELRKQLIDSLPRQSSPLVQIALIDLMVEQHERQSVEALRRLADDQKTNDIVRQRARWALQQVS